MAIHIVKTTENNGFFYKLQRFTICALTKLVIWLYTILFTLALPFVFFRLYLKSRKNTSYRQRWLERLGIFPELPAIKRSGLWIHAVSVGETVASGPLILAFHQKFPHIPITITTTTPTGSDRVKLLFKDLLKTGSLFHFYFPYDLPFAIRGFLKRIQPKLCIFMETELWPNMLNILKKREIPCMIANGRLSLKSMKGYKKLVFLTKEIFKNIQGVAAQTEQDSARFHALGLEKECIKVTGNIKFDIALPAEDSSDTTNKTTTSKNLKSQWNTPQPSRPVWIAASTHPGEETLILWVFSELKKDLQFANILLILVPRHPERFQCVAEEIEKWNFKYSRRSFNKFNNTCNHFNDSNNMNNVGTLNDTEILLGDTMGELPLLYAVSTLAFVGGSLAPIGGHNTLEPAIQGCPILVGPHTHNFQEITKKLKEAGALIQVNDKFELLSDLKILLSDTERMKKMGEKGKQVIIENQGATDKILEMLSPFFKD